MKLKVSIIIPTYNRCHALERCLHSLAQQTVDKAFFEVIVVDDGSTDQTQLVMEKFSISRGSFLQYHYQSNQGPAAARNLGIAHAKGEFIAFTDDDCLPAPDWLEKLLNSFPESSTCAGIGGRTIRLHDNAISHYIDDLQIMNCKVQDGEVPYVITANALYRRSCITEVQGFTENFTWPGGEDPDLSFRLKERGYYLTMTPQALVYHEHRNRLVSLYTMFRNHGRGNAIMGFSGTMPLIKPNFCLELRNFRNLAEKHLRRKDMKTLEKMRFILFDAIYIMGSYFGYRSEYSKHTSI